MPPEPSCKFDDTVVEATAAGMIKSFGSEFQAKRFNGTSTSCAASKLNVIGGAGRQLYMPLKRTTVFVPALGFGRGLGLGFTITKPESDFSVPVFFLSTGEDGVEISWTGGS